MPEIQITESEALRISGFAGLRQLPKEDKQISEFEAFEMVQAQLLRKPKVDTSALLESIRGADLGNAENSQRLFDTYIADRMGLDPFSNHNANGSSTRAFLGLESGASVPDSATLLQGVKDMQNPPASHKDWQSHKEFQDVNKRIMAGEKVADVELEIGFIAEYMDVFKEKSIQRRENAWVNKFNKSPIDQRNYGEQILSKKMQDFAYRTMMKKSFNYVTFNKPGNFTEKEKNYFFTYLRAINKDQDLGYLNEVGERLSQSGYDIGQSYKSAALWGHEFAKGVDDKKMLYLQTKDIKDPDKLRKFIETDLRLRYRRGEMAPGFFGAEGFIAPGNSEFDAKKQTDEILANYDAFMAEGKEMVDRQKANRGFRAAIRKHFTERETLPGRMGMATVSMALDMGFAIAAGLPTMGIGAGIHGFARFAPEFREDLILDGGVAPGEATALALVTSIPYAGAEMLQLKIFKGLASLGKEGVKQESKQLFLKGFQQAFKKHVMSKKGAPIVDKFVKGYGSEVGVEGFQSLTEQFGLAYAKEYLEARGIRIADLEANFWMEIEEAAKGMFFMSAGAMGIGGARRMISNKIDAIDMQKALGEKAIAEGGNDYADVNTAFDSQVQVKMLKEIELADTLEQKEAILKEYDSELSVPDADVESQALKNIQQKSMDEALLTIEQQRVEHEQVAAKSKRAVTPEILQKSVGEFATITEVEAGKFTVEAKVDGGVKYNINIIPEADFQDTFGARKLAVWDPNTKTITLPTTATDFKVAHENLHMMRDLGVITDAELNQLVTDAKKVASDSFLESIKDLDEESQQQELAANLIEEMQKTGTIPEGLNTIWEKIKRWTRDIGSALIPTLQKSGVAIAKDVLTGKPLARPVDMTKEEQQRFSEEQDTNTKRLEVVTLAKRILKGNRVPKKTSDAVAQAANQIAVEATKNINDMTDDVAIDKEVRDAEIDLYYNGRRAEIFQEGMKIGEKLTKETARIKRQIKKEETARQKKEQPLTEIDVLVEDTATILGVEDFEATSFINTLEKKVSDAVSKKLGKATQTIIKAEQAYQNALEKYAVKIRGTVIETVMNEGGLIFDEDMQQALKETGLLKGQAKTLLKKDKGLTSDQMIKVLEKNGVIKKGEIGSRAELLEYIDTQSKAFKKPKKPRTTAAQKVLKAEYTLLHKGVMQNTLTAIADKMLNDVIPGKTKDTLKRDLEKIGDLTTLPAIIRKSLKLFGDINQAQIAQIDKDTLVDKFTRITKGLLQELPSGKQKEIFKNRASGIQNATNVLKYSETLVKDINKAIIKQHEGKTIVEAVNKIAKRMLKELKPGRVKQMLKNRLVTLSTAPDIQKVADELIRDIQNAVLKKQAADVKKNINKMLKPYTKRPDAKIEKVKAKRDVATHIALNWGINNIIKAKSKREKTGKMDADGKPIYKTVATIDQVLEHLQESIQDVFNQTTKENDYLQAEKVAEATMQVSMFNLFYQYSRNKNLSVSELTTIETAIQDFIDEGTAKLEKAKMDRIEAINNDLTTLLPALSEREELRVKRNEELPSFRPTMQTPYVNVENTYKLGLDEEAQARLNLILNDAATALFKKTEMASKLAEQMHIAAEQILGKNGLDKFREIVPGSEKFSNEGKPLNVDELLHKFSDIRQQQGQELANYKDEDGNHLNPYYKKLQDGQAEMEEMLGPEAIQLLDKMTEIIDSTLEEINEVMFRIFGHKILQIESKYFPILQERDQIGFDEVHKTINFFQKFMHTRVLHRNASADIGAVSHFLEHTSEVAKFIHMTDSAIYNRDLFLGKDMIKAVKGAWGTKYTKHFTNNVTDMSVDKATAKEHTTGDALIDMGRAYSSITLLAFSGYSSARQIVGVAPGYALQLDASTMFAMAKNIPQFFQKDSDVRKAFVAIFNTYWMQSRMQKGFSEETINAIKTGGPRVLKNYIKYGMRVPGYGDVVGNSAVGALLYVTIQQQGKYDGFPKSEQFNRIMGDMLLTVEATQQASLIATMPGILRNSSSGTKALLQFASNPIAQASYYAQSWSDIYYHLRKAGYKFDAKNPITWGEFFVAIGKNKAARKEFGKLMLLQHGLLPASQALVGLAYAFADKGELDEDDLVDVVMTLAAGPMAGVFMVNNIMKSLMDKARGRSWGGGNLPISKPGNDIALAMKLLNSLLIDNDFDEALKDTDKLLQQLAPPFKHIRKITDDK